jgi:hypothetical protein
MTNLFTTATAFRIEGCDRYESPEECIVNWAEDSEGWRVGERFSVTVHAYGICERQHLDYDNMSDDVMTMVEEAWADANMNLLGMLRSDPDAYRACKQTVWTALAEFAATLPVTKLTDKPVASRTYSADEVLTVLREAKPKRFREVANG